MRATSQERRNYEKQQRQTTERCKRDQSFIGYLLRETLLALVKDPHILREAKNYDAGQNSAHDYKN